MDPSTKTPVTFSPSSYEKALGRYPSDEFCPSLEASRSNHPPCHVRLQFPTGSLLLSPPQTLHEVLGGPVAEGPHRQRRVDAGTGGEDRSAEYVQPGRVVDAQIRTNHRRGGGFAHAAPAEVVAAANAAKAWAAPRLRRPHRAQDLLGLGLHPLGEAPLVLPQIAGDPHQWEP